MISPFRTWFQVWSQPSAFRNERESQVFEKSGSPPAPRSPSTVRARLIHLRKAFGKISAQTMENPLVSPGKAD
jgi:hypothetical protein